MAEKMSAKQEQAVLLLASGEAVQEVASAVGVSRATVWKWKRDGHFLAELHRLRNEFRESAIAAVLSLHREASEVLRKCLQSDDDATALRAARFVLERVEAHPPEDEDHFTLRMAMPPNEGLLVFEEEAA